MGLTRIRTPSTVSYGPNSDFSIGFLKLLLTLSLASLPPPHWIL